MINTYAEHSKKTSSNEMIATTQLSKILEEITILKTNANTQKDNHHQHILDTITVTPLAYEQMTEYLSKLIQKRKSTDSPLESFLDFIIVTSIQNFVQNTRI